MMQNIFQATCRFELPWFVVTANPPETGTRIHSEESNMQVMVMVKATPSSETGAMPSEELLTAMGKYNEELAKAGILLAAEGLHPSSRGKRVRFSGSGRTLIDGPFAETKELVAGFWLWQVRSMDEAIEWVRRCPNPMPEDSEIEIRPVFDAEDFGTELSQAAREQAERIAEIAAQNAKP